MAGKQVGDRRQARVELVDFGVDLDPVAGGHDERARHRLGFEDVTQQLAERVAADSGPFQHRYRGALVTQAHDQDAHGAATADSPIMPPAPIADSASAGITRPAW